MCAARRIPFSPCIVPHEKKERRAPTPTRRSANVKRGVELESANRSANERELLYRIPRRAIGGPSGKAMICGERITHSSIGGRVHERQLQSVTHPPPTSCLGGTGEIQLSERDQAFSQASAREVSKVKALPEARRGSGARTRISASFPDRLKESRPILIQKKSEGAPSGKRLSIIVARLPNRQLLKYQRLLSLAFISGLFTTSYQRCFRGIVPHEKERAQSPGPTRRSANVKRGVEPRIGEPKGARTTTPNVTHPPPTYCLGGTGEIQLR
ncbi:hypothetical protein OIU84_029066 [Salix udensis]|uniref:Uncharacterized protein n=1 Tax=Salix udensis TaxID=889485 RepID=A0AAD6PA21_9ROSI|nr:hypothetical protein OIU84_029066 [Salix udensis]